MACVLVHMYVHMDRHVCAPSWRSEGNLWQHSSGPVYFDFFFWDKSLIGLGSPVRLGQWVLGIYLHNPSAGITECVLTHSGFSLYHEFQG